MSRFPLSPLGQDPPASRVAAVVLFALGGLSPLSTHAATLTLPPVADASLYEESATTTANGAGEILAAGRTNQPTGSRRRSLLRFDLSSLPDGAVISSVSLRLFLFTVTTAETGLSLHRATTAWTEGPSDPAGNESNGAAAVVGDATWNFASFDASAWTASGGDALAAPSATLSVGTTSGYYTWSSAGLTSDAAAWVTDPLQNFGWLLRGDELAPQTAKRFASSENEDPSRRPLLLIEFEPIPEPQATALVAGALAMLFRPRRRTT